MLVAAAKGGLGVLGRIAAGAFRGRVLKQRVRFFIASVEKADLLYLKQLVEAGKLTPCIDRTYPLAETGQALRYIETGHAHGHLGGRLRDLRGADQHRLDGPGRLPQQRAERVPLLLQPAPQSRDGGARALELRRRLAGIQP